MMATTLSVGEAKTTRSQFLPEDAVFLLKVGVDILLLPKDPAG